MKGKGDGMIIYCPYCHEVSESDFKIEEGRRVQCPYCLAKFKYRHHAYEGHEIRTWLFKLYRKIPHICCVRRRKPLIVGGVILFLLTLIVFRTSCVSDKSPFGYGGLVSLRTYNSTEQTKFDFGIRATREGAFGFSWGEHPMSKEYDTPCVVEYNITGGFFSRLRLTYSEKGELFMISLCGDGRSFPPIPRELPVASRRGIRRSYMEDTLYIFRLVLELAEQLTDQEFTCCRFKDKLVGVSEGHGDGYSAGVRVDIPPQMNPEIVFFVMRNSN